MYIYSIIGATLSLFLVIGLAWLVTRLHSNFFSRIHSNSKCTSFEVAQKEYSAIGVPFNSAKSGVEEANCERMPDGKRLAEKMVEEKTVEKTHGLKNTVILANADTISKKERWLIGLLGCCFLLVPLGFSPAWFSSVFATVLFYFIFIGVGFYLMVSVSQSILLICYNCFIVLLPLWVHGLLAGYGYGLGVPGLLWGFDAYVNTPLLATKGVLFWSSLLLAISCCLSMPYIAKPSMLATVYSLLWGSLMVSFFVPIVLLREVFSNSYMALFIGTVFSLICVVALLLMSFFIGRWVRCLAIIGVYSGGYFGAWLIYKSVL